MTISDWETVFFLTKNANEHKKKTFKEGLFVRTSVSKIELV